MNYSIIKNKKWLFYLCGIILIIFIYSIISLIVNNNILLPNIYILFKTLINVLITKETLIVILSTFIRIIICIIISLIIALIILYIYIIFPFFKDLLKPFITLMRSTPIACISILLFFLIGANLSPYIITIFMILPVMIEALYTGYNNINQDLKDEMKLNKGSFIKEYFKIYLPLIRSFISMGLIQTIGMSFKVMIMAEYICQTNESIGKTIYSLKANFTSMDYLIAWIIIIIVIVTLIEVIIKAPFYKKNKHLIAKNNKIG